MPVEFLSDEQVARYGGFLGDPSAYDLERFFRLNAEGSRLLKGKRRDENRLGFAVQWGTVRMLGTFLGENPTAVPRGVAAFVAEQLAIADPECLGAYAERPMTAYEHQWEIRRECGYREFASGELELREFLAARVWALEEGPRALFDRAVLRLIEQRVLLPGITVLARLVADVRADEHERIHGLLAEAPTAEQLERFERLLHVPKDARTSELDQLRGGRR
ncbi:MAG: DUF4158 domain-containing protein [Solirubrobacteraceae bacterium]